MAGIYIHIPFCRQKCSYCNFYSVVNTGLKKAFVEKLKEEIHLRKNYLQEKPVHTIYLGGGSPSLLSAGELHDIFETLFKHFSIASDAEITLEANPDHINKQKIKTLQKTPVNRLSIGIQSFFEEDLQYLNRRHEARCSKEILKNIQDAGFSNISIDLIYGIPTLTNDRWLQNLHAFFDLHIPHLSAYGLSVEAHTPLHKMIQLQKKMPVSETQSVTQYKLLLRQMHEQEYIHYEISNFAKKEFYSRHNSLYWKGGHYLGLGPSAHSYNGKSRQWNTSDLSKYLALSSLQQSPVFEKEILSMQQQYNEYVMTSLRTHWGCDLEHITNTFGLHYSSYCLQQAQTLIKDEKIRQKGNILTLSDAGKLFADGIASKLFYET